MRTKIAHPCYKIQNVYYCGDIGFQIQNLTSLHIQPCPAYLTHIEALCQCKQSTFLARLTRSQAQSYVQGL